MDENTPGRQRSVSRRRFLATAAAGAAGVTTVGSAAATPNNSTASGGNQSASGNGTTTGGSASGGGGGGGGGGKVHEVAMITDGSDYIFDPIGLFVKPGDTVRWYIESGNHTTTSYTKDNPRANTRRIPKGAKGWNSGTLKKKGAAFEYTFEVKGTYDYYCVPHKTLGMVGRIVCGEPGGPATKSPIPDKPASGIMPPSKKIVEKKKIPYPYIPESKGGGIPGLAIGATVLFGLANTYLLSEYDLLSGRYDEDEEFEDDTETGE